MFIFDRNWNINKPIIFSHLSSVYYENQASVNMTQISGNEKSAQGAAKPLINYFVYSTKPIRKPRKFGSTCNAPEHAINSFVS